MPKFCICGRVAVALCDGATGEKPCDKPICEQHAKRMKGLRLAFCPEHAKELKKRPKEETSPQTELF